MASSLFLICLRKFIYNVFILGIVKLVHAVDFDDTFDKECF
jgi:hypothetical protein